MEPQFIDNIASLTEFINTLPSCNNNWPSLYIDLEGNDLSRHGTLSLLTILVEPRRAIHIIDITELGNEAFVTEGSDNRCLKSILESSNIIKVFFDIRNDSDALFSHCNIHVAGIEDLKLMELASRRFSKRLVNGLARCIENDAELGHKEKQQSKHIKDKGRRLFAPELGGSYAVFDQRSLAQQIKDYCVQDVLVLPALREIYLAKLCDAWWIKIEEETVARIALSQSSSYSGKGRHMAEGPRGWLIWSPSPAQWQCRDLIKVKSCIAGSIEQDELSNRLGAESVPSLRSTPSPLASSSTAPITRADQPSFGPAGRGVQQVLETDALVDSFNSVDLLNDYHNDLEDYDGSVFHDQPYFGYSSDEDRFEDLTACDKECGYCGRCMY